MSTVDMESDSLISSAIVVDHSSWSGPRRTSGGGGSHDLQYLFLFWAASYLSAVLAQWTRLSPLLFYLLFGVIFINTHIVADTEFLKMLAEVAITIVFFSLGFEENVDNFLKGIRKAWGIASIGALVPFACGFSAAFMFWPDLGIKPALMCGLAVTATAVSLTMITLKSEGLALSKAAIGIMTSAVLDDVAALALVAIMVPICTGEAEPTVLGIGWILAKSVIFFAMIVILSVIVFPHDLSETPILKHIPIVRTLGMHHLLRFHGGEQAVVVALMSGLGVGLIGQELGFHPAIGAYMTGLILEERYFDLAPEPRDESEDDVEASRPKIVMERSNTKENVFDHKHNVYHHVKDVLENAAFCWVGPIFFIHLGAQIEIQVNVMKNVVVESLTIFAMLFVGQIASAALAARYVPGGFNWAESLMIGFGMLGRAELFFVVLNICYVENNIFSTEMFYALTFAAMLLNIMVPVTISLYKPYYTGEKQSCFTSAAQSMLDDKDQITVHQFGWLHRKVMSAHRQFGRRVYQVDTDIDFNAAGIARKTPQKGGGVGSIQEEMAGLTKLEDTHWCKVEGCVRSVCVVCKHVNKVFAENLAEGNIQRLAYEDFDDEVPRTISGPEVGPDHRHFSAGAQEDEKRGNSSMTISGATGKNLAREMRQHIEGRDHRPEAYHGSTGGVHDHVPHSQLRRPHSKEPLPEPAEAVANTGAVRFSQSPRSQDDATIPERKEEASPRQRKKSNYGRPATDISSI